MRLQSIAMNAPVSLSALIFLGTTHSKLLALPKAMARSSSGSVIYSSGFVGDVMFSHNRPGKGNTRGFLLKLTHQGAAPDWRRHLI